MKPIAQFDCFISFESSNNLQLLDHSRLNNSDEYSIVNMQYKHKIPDLKMTVEHNSFDSNCKSSFRSTESKLVSSADNLNKASKFVAYFTGNEIHFVPLTRPGLTLCNGVETVPEYKKNNKDKSKTDYNPILETKKSLEKFHEISKDKSFPFLSDTEKTRQPWIPVHVDGLYNNTNEIRQSMLVCYKRDELKPFEIPEICKPKRKVSKPSLIQQTNYHSAAKYTSLESEILTILMENNVIRFGKLMEFIKDQQKIDSSELTEKNVLNHLMKLAVSIRGHWVIKSEVFYKISNVDVSIPVERLCLARDYILSVFYNGDNVTTKTVQSKTKMPSMVATDLLGKLAERVKDSKTGMWKFPEHDYEFILKNYEINQRQIELMNQKVKEVFAKLKIDMVQTKGTSLNQKRLRTYSSQIDYKSNLCLSPMKRKRTREFSHIESIGKRVRQTSAHYGTTKSMWNEDGSFDFDVDFATNSDEKNVKFVDTCARNKSMETVNVHQGFVIKGEPNLVQCQLVQADEDFENEQAEEEEEEEEGEEDEIDGFSHMKTEVSDICSTKENDNQSLPFVVPLNNIKSDFPQNFPSIVVYNDMKQFILTQCNILDILPTTDLAESYRSEHMSKLNHGDLGNWKSKNQSSVKDSIILCMNELLDSIGAQKIDITWPKNVPALPEQNLYLSNKESIKKDTVIISVIIDLLKANGQFVIGDIKKEMATNLDYRFFIPPNDNMLRDKLKKYCHYVHRKYFLKNTVVLQK